MVRTHRTQFDNATRFFDFHWPITLILVWIFQIFRSAITFWVIWSTYLWKFALIGCFIIFQKLKNCVVLSNCVRCVWTLVWTFTLITVDPSWPPVTFVTSYDTQELWRKTTGKLEIDYIAFVVILSHNFRYFWLQKSTDANRTFK